MVKKKSKKQEEPVIFPEVHGCTGCKHLSKKITESPCDVCDCWGSRWEPDENE